MIAILLIIFFIVSLMITTVPRFANNIFGKPKSNYRYDPYFDNNDELLDIDSDDYYPGN
jgi:hypothetical protein